MRSLLSALLHGQDYLFSGSCRSQKVWRRIKELGKKKRDQKKEEGLQEVDKKKQDQKKKMEECGIHEEKERMKQVLNSGLRPDSSRHNISLLLVQTPHEAWILSSDWYRLILWPKYYPMLAIG